MITGKQKRACPGCGAWLLTNVFGYIDPAKRRRHSFSKRHLLAIERKALQK